jgi:hypothetical protein
MLFLNIQIFTVLITYAQHIRVLFSKYPRWAHYAYTLNRKM